MTEPSDVVLHSLDAVANAITASARKHDDPEKLKLLAEAASALRFGPQGGSYDYSNQTDYRQFNKTIYHYQADYHDTRHEGEKRDRPAGFARDD